MTGDEPVELWINRYKMEALETALGDSSVESKMRELLEKLYEDMVPEETRRQIDARLQAEYEADRAVAEANRRFAVFRVREHGEQVCFLVNSPTNFLNAATTFRNYERGTTAESFADCFPGSLKLSQDEVRQYLSERLEENSGRVTGVFDFDIDAGTVTTLGEDNTWHAYRLKDVSVAVYYANRNKTYSYLGRSVIIQDHLAGRELEQETPSDLTQSEEPAWPQGPIM